jgi:GTPase KRas protein
MDDWTGLRPQWRYTALRHQRIIDGDAFVLNYCITKRSSFARIRRYHNQILRVKESLASSPSFPGSPISGQCQQDCPLVLIANNSDRVSEREVSTEEGYALAKELGCEFFEFSARGCISIESPFHEIVRQLRRRQRLQARVARRPLSLLGAAQHISAALYRKSGGPIPHEA